MSSTTSTPPARLPEAHPWSGWGWRIVEAQHVAATMKLVDGAADQDVLENLLENNKPAVPAAAADLDYLLAAPFRYAANAFGSRFRAKTDPGVFYAAENVATACSELGYWRWKFLRDAVDLDSLQPVAHTAFKTKIATEVVDLRALPFSADKHLWMHPTNYAATQSLAKTARLQRLGGIVYQSVRNPEPSWCIAVLTPAAFASRKPEKHRQTWWLSVQQETVIWRLNGQALVFSMKAWVT